MPYSRIEATYTKAKAYYEHVCAEMPQDLRAEGLVLSIHAAAAWELLLSDNDGACWASALVTFCPWCGSKLASWDELEA